MNITAKIFDHEKHIRFRRIVRQIVVWVAGLNLKPGHEL